MLSWMVRSLLRVVVRLYEQDWFHWFASITLGIWDTLFGVYYRVVQWMFQFSLWKDWQNRPAPSYPIPMTKDDVPVKPSRSDAAGQYIATMITTYVDVTELEQYLPKGMVLDPSRIYDGKHSVIYMLGYTENLHRVWNPLPGIDYMEFAIGIPEVRIPAQEGYNYPFFHIPRLYLSRLYPVVMGWMVGYRKLWAWVYGKNKTYHIARLGGKKIMSATFEVGDLPPLVMGGPKAVTWRELLSEPHANWFGPDDFLFLHYHWDWTDALLQPVNAHVEVFEPIPGLLPGKYDFAPLNTGEWQNGMAPTGAFRLCAPFELLAPFDSKALANFRMPAPPAPVA